MIAPNPLHPRGTSVQLAPFRSQSMRALPAAALLLCAVAASPRARAQPPEAASTAPSPPKSLTVDERVTKLNEQGARLYERGEYRRALERFIEAYAVDNDATLLFNIAHCYEKLGDTQAAREKYEAFLNGSGPEAPGRGQARKRLSALRRAAAAPPAVRRREPVAMVSGGAAPADSEASWIEQATPWALVVSGIALGTAGTLYFISGAQDHSSLTGQSAYDNPSRVSPLTRAEASELVDEGTRKKYVGGAGLALGVGLLATYVGVYLLGGDEEAPAVGAALEGDRPTVTISGTF